MRVVHLGLHPFYGVVIRGLVGEGCGGRVHLGCVWRCKVRGTVVRAGGRHGKQGVWIWFGEGVVRDGLRRFCGVAMCGTAGVGGGGRVHLGCVWKGV